MKTRIFGRSSRFLFILFVAASVGLLFNCSATALSVNEIREQYYKSYNYEKLQDYENAVKTLFPVFKKYEGGYTVNLRLGWLYFLKRNYANSISHYQKAVGAAPYSIEAKLGHTLPLMVQKKYDKVETILYQILSVDQNNYHANLRLIRICRLQKKYDLAEKVAKGMLTLYPTNISFLTELALIKRAKGEKKEAAALFEDILILDPENTVAKTYTQSRKKPGARRNK